MEWKVGDKLLPNTEMVLGGSSLEDGKIYDVVSLDGEGLPEIEMKYGGILGFLREEMPYVERVTNSEESERNTELGAPPPDVTVGCNCGTLTVIHEELTDIKSMIGRLLKEGYEMAPVDDGGDTE